MKEYAIYPFVNVNITQNYDEGNHILHWKDSYDYSDLPWDEAGKDSSSEYFIPQNDFIIEEVLGINSNVTNSVRLKSVNKLYIPYIDDAVYLYLTLTHMSEDNIINLQKGQIIKKNEKLLLEGHDGNATGNHFHVTANLGKYYGMLKNSNSSWCFVYEKSLKPDEAFYIDSNFNNLISTKSNNFKVINQSIINSVNRNELVNQLEVIINNLRIRETPSINGKILGVIPVGIYDYLDVQKNDGYTWYFVGVGYIAYNDDWIKLYPKKSNVSDNINVSEICIIKKIINKILEIIKKIIKKSN